MFPLLYDEMNMDHACVFLSFCAMGLWSLTILAFLGQFLSA